MRSTTDTYTGKPFRYNQIVAVDMFRSTERRRRVNTVGRITSRTNQFLHPDRLTPAMFAQLNPEEI